MIIHFWLVPLSSFPLVALLLHAFPLVSHLHTTLKEHSFLIPDTLFLMVRAPQGSSNILLNFLKSSLPAHLSQSHTSCNIQVTLPLGSRVYYCNGETECPEWSYIALPFPFRLLGKELPKCFAVQGPVLVASLLTMLLPMALERVSIVNLFLDFNIKKWFSDIQKLQLPMSILLLTKMKLHVHFLST